MPELVVDPPNRSCYLLFSQSGIEQSQSLLPLPLASIEPAERLGIDLSSLRTVEEFPRVLTAVLAAVARGEIAPAEAAHIARRVRARLRPARLVKPLSALQGGEGGAQPEGLGG